MLELIEIIFEKYNIDPAQQTAYDKPLCGMQNYASVHQAQSCHYSETSFI